MFQLKGLSPTRIFSQNVSSTKSKMYDLDSDIKIQCFSKDQNLSVSFFLFLAYYQTTTVFLSSILT